MNNYYCTNNGCNPCPPQPPKPTMPPIPRCACGEEFRRLLSLLCGSQLQTLVDFSAFAFVTDYFVLGSALTAPAGTAAPGDNLDAPAGGYLCGSDRCETISVSGSLYPPTVGATALEATVTQIALCRLKAVIFNAAATDTATAAVNFQSIRRILSEILHTETPQTCGSMADALTGAAAVRASTVVAGPLVVENGAIVGQRGNLLVLSNSTDNRFYLLCADQVDYIG